jgi:hypothetical protein
MQDVTLKEFLQNNPSVEIQTINSLGFIRAKVETRIINMNGKEFQTLKDFFPDEFETKLNEIKWPIFYISKDNRQTIVCYPKNSNFHF